MVSDDSWHSLLIDLYELTMADAYRRSGMAEVPATFSLFVRSLPSERGYMVAAGLDDALTWLEQMRFGDEALGAIDRLGMFDDAFLRWLGALRFTGRVRAVPEGTIVFPHQPILEIDAPIAQGQLAETFLLNQVTVQTLLATTAARYRHAADGRSLIDFGFRRAQGIDAGMKVARVGRIVGLDGTSNVAGADRYELPASGTMAHSFVQARHDETDAFRVFADALTDATVLLVDTYDTLRGVEAAIVVAREMRERGVEIRGIRLDSGDLDALAREARGLLDDAGFPAVQIFASGGLDEHEIDVLVRSGAPIDGFGVGTALAVSADAPSLDSAYKLVSVGGRGVRKTSAGKATLPGAKQVWRARDWSGDVLALADEPEPGTGYEPLLEDVMVDGMRTDVGRRGPEEASRAFDRAWATLPEQLKHLRHPEQYIVDISAAVRKLADAVDAERKRSDPDTSS